MKYFAIVLMCIFGAMAFTPAATAQSDPIYTSWRNNAALGGYDAISFFNGKPQKGKSDYSFTYKGARWLFASETNLNKFRATPDEYLPEYGGYCAWAAAKNKLAKGSPEFWEVVDGKLYLNFNARIQNRWKARQADFIIKADDNWPEILDK